MVCHISRQCVCVKTCCIILFDKSLFWYLPKDMDIFHKRERSWPLVMILFITGTASPHLQSVKVQSVRGIVGALVSFSAGLFVCEENIDIRVTFRWKQLSSTNKSSVLSVVVSLSSLFWFSLRSTAVFWWTRSSHQQCS